ncbi:MAG: hypothetical protein WCT18_04945 [Patescibacteria group bacterium]
MEVKSMQRFGTTELIEDYKKAYTEYHQKNVPELIKIRKETINVRKVHVVAWFCVFASLFFILFKLAFAPYVFCSSLILYFFVKKWRKEKDQRLAHKEDFVRKQRELFLQDRLVKLNALEDVNLQQYYHGVSEFLHSVPEAEKIML